MVRKGAWTVIAVAAAIALSWPRRLRAEELPPDLYLLLNLDLFKRPPAQQQAQSMGNGSMADQLQVMEKLGLFDSRGESRPGHSDSDGNVDHDPGSGDR